MHVYTIMYNLSCISSFIHMYTVHVQSSVSLPGGVFGSEVMMEGDMRKVLPVTGVCLCTCNSCLMVFTVYGICTV